jgi:hypothetical protein
MAIGTLIPSRDRILPSRDRILPSRDRILPSRDRKGADTPPGSANPAPRPRLPHVPKEPHPCP